MGQFNMLIGLISDEVDQESWMDSSLTSGSLYYYLAHYKNRD